MVAVSAGRTLRRDVYEKKYGEETSEVAFDFYNLISNWHTSWSEHYSYSGLYHTVQRFEVAESWRIFASLPEEIQRTTISAIKNYSSWSFYQLLTVFDRMVSTGFKGTVSFHLDLSKILKSDVMASVKNGVVSSELFSIFHHNSPMSGMISHHLVYLVGASRLFGESNVIEVLQRAKDSSISLHTLDLVAILSQWDEMKVYPMDWIIKVATNA